jgi:hypothetical protein
MRREGRGVMGCEGREVMRREGQSHVTACAGSTGTLAFGEAAASWGWDSAQRSVVTRQGTEWAAAGACGPRVTGAGWSHVTDSDGPGPVREKSYVMCGRECYRSGVAWR